MSIKDLFTKSKIAIYESAESASVNLESAEFLKEKINENNTFIPFVDFSDPSVFIKFGSAKLYYDNSIKRVYNQYPYDGSAKEKIQFQQSSSYLDRWLFDNKYPKSTGYAILTANGYGSISGITDGYGAPVAASREFISVFGGIHTASAGMKTGELFKNFDDSIIYDANKNRTQNFRVNPSDGTTIEFWLNKSNFITSSTEKEVILDLWNGNLASASDYGRLTIYITGSSDGLSPFRATMQNGTTGFSDQSLAATTFTTASLADGEWHHYAVSFLSQSSGVKSFFYVDGDLNNEQTIGSTGIDEFDGRVNAYIGALQASPSGSSAPQFAGKLSASLDEFRYWKKRRTSKEINLNWYRPINGGSNTEDNNTSLGCYFKFNEGITGTDSIDSTVLDYSGRLANGAWTGYSNSARNVGSCFVSASVLSTEPADPILYPTHPDVIAVTAEMETSGSDYDQLNSTFLYDKLPQFMRDDDEENDEDIKKLYQILSSYFDTIYSQTKVLPLLTNKNYLSSSTKPLPFSNRLLESRGFVTSELFVNTDILEFYGDNDFENIKYIENVNDIKNLIYHNIYNNLDYIYKTKGSEKSFRNLLRCFGVDDELVKFNVYTDGGMHYFNDNFKDSSVTAKFINHNNPSYFGGSIYQDSSVNNPRTFISGSSSEKLEKNNAFTFEVDVLIPEKIPATDPAFFDTLFISSSIGGFHQATTADYTWASGEIANAQMFLVRDEIESNRAKFVLSNQDGTVHLTSSFYDDIYDNERWILATRVKPLSYPIEGSYANSSNPTYEISFYGVNYEFGEVKNRFSVSASLDYASGSSYLSEAKRVYVGAHRTNFTGSVLQNSDLEIGACRFWFDYLSDFDLSAHSKDITNLGVDNSTRNGTLFTDQLTNVPIPRSDTLALNWDFDLVTSSSVGGTFEVVDVSSGSTDTIYGWIDNIIRREHKGVSIGYGSNATSFVDKELIYVSKKELPEISVTSDNIFVKDDEQKFFIKDDDVSDNFYSLEKSMYQIISEDMLSMFASAIEFNNLIGLSVDRYRHRYKNLDKMRQLFFEKVESDMDFDKFTNYYKWIDSAISEMMSQLYPASIKHSDSIADMVESHILERNKYQNKLPLTTRLESTEGSIRGVSEIDYNWKFGHAPVDGAENKNCLWQKERKERTDIADRETIRKSINNTNNKTGPSLFKNDGTSYQGSTYAVNRLSKPYKEGISFDNSIHGGINFNKGKDRDFVYSATYIHGPVSTDFPKGIPQNVMVVGVGEGQGTDAFIDCADEEDPNEKRKWRFSAVLGRNSTGQVPVARTGLDYEFKVKSSLYWPSNLVSGSVTTGYNSKVVNKFKSGSIITNLHSDTFSPTNDIGMQGPFTEAHVGGHQSRHVDLNKHDTSLMTEGGGATLNNLDDQYSRPEAWRLLLNECGDDPNAGIPPNIGSQSGSNDGAMGFVGPDYGGPYPDTSRRYARRYRDERTKRPLNVRNIRTTTGSAVHGNFAENYEIVHTFGRKENSKGFVRSEGVQLSSFFDGLPSTTQEASLVGVRARFAGNLVTSFYNSNRIALDIRGQQAVDANTFGNTVIATRFSAPGSFETMSEIFLDVASKEYSAYNAMPFRNLSVRGSGSGETGTIRLNSPAGRREGLRTLLARHSGRFGIDSQHGAVVSNNYDSEASFHKINRNTSVNTFISDTIAGSRDIAAAKASGLLYLYPSSFFKENDKIEFGSGPIQETFFLTGPGAFGTTVPNKSNFKSGSSNSQFWGNFKSAVITNPAGAYSASFSTIGGNSGNGLSFVNIGGSEGVLLSGSTAGSLLASGSFSFSMWFYQSSSFTNAPEGHIFQIKDDTFIGTSDVNNVAFSLSTTKFRFFRKTTGGAREWSTDHDIKSGLEDQWNNVVLTYRNDATASAGMVNIYVNGAAKSISYTGPTEAISGSGDTNSAVAWLNDETGSIPVGQYNENLKRMVVKEFSWWNTEITSSDIGAVYNNGAPVDYATGSWNKLAHYWPFSGSSDNFDRGSSPAYNGTLFLKDEVGNGNISGSVKQTAGNEITWYTVPLTQSQVALFNISANFGGSIYNNFNFVTSSTQFEPYSLITNLAGGTDFISGTAETFVFDNKDKFDNFNTSRAIPSQDYNYSWVTSSLGEELSVRAQGQQLAFGYWPKDGILSASANVSWRNNGFDSAVNFPTGSYQIDGVVF